MHDINTRIFYTTKTRRKKRATEAVQVRVLAQQQVEYKYSTSPLLHFTLLYFTLHYLDSASYGSQEHAQWQQLLCHQLNSL